MKVGIIGVGAIATFLLKNQTENPTQAFIITRVYVRNKAKYSALEVEYGVKLYTDLQQFLASGIDIVVEAATMEAAERLLPKIVKKKDVVIISIGALANTPLLQSLYSAAEQHNHFIYLPSGAIGGLDLLQNACASRSVSEVSLTTRKPARTLIADEVEKETIVFAGKAMDAIKRFPKNINVSIVLAIAGIGIKQTNVTIIADPSIESNIHTVDIVGDFGKASLTIQNEPLPDNPKTSYLAAMSILGTLQRLSNRMKIGS